MKRSISLLALFVSSLVTLPATAAILVTSANRSVALEGTGAAPDGDSTTAGGVFNPSLMITASSPGGTTEVNAIQDSSIPDLLGHSMNGASSVFSITNETGPGESSVSAESFFDVFFKVTLDEVYRLYAEITWLGDIPPMEGHSSVQLLDVTNATVLFELQRDQDSSGFGSLNEALPLSTGVTYRLRAEALFMGETDSGEELDSFVNWTFSFSVPEPSGLVLLTVGFAALVFDLRRVARG